MSILLAGSVCLLPYEMVMASELLIEWGRTFGGSGRDGSDSVRESSDNREATAKKNYGHIGEQDNSVVIVKDGKKARVQTTEFVIDEQRSGVEHFQGHYQFYGYDYNFDYYDPDWWYRVGIQHQGFYPWHPWIEVHGCYVSNREFITFLLPSEITSGQMEVDKAWLHATYPNGKNAELAEGFPSGGAMGNFHLDHFESTDPDNVPLWMPGWRQGDLSGDYGDESPIVPGSNPEGDDFNKTTLGSVDSFLPGESPAAEVEEVYDVTSFVKADLNAGRHTTQFKAYLDGIFVYDWDGGSYYWGYYVAVEWGMSLVIVVKTPPVAYFTYSPENPVVGEEITFDASSSHDSDGTIVSYGWDFGDTNSASGQVVTHTYSEPSEYTVTLTVTDNDGLEDSLSKFITVKRPVLLVHGINADSNTWNTMIPYLEAEGYVQNENLFTIDLTGHDIKGYGQQVCNKLKEIKSNTGATKVDIVAHSMGGLASRWCIQKLDGDIDVAKLIMLGTPNHGSLGFAPWMQSDVWWVPPQGASWDLLQMLPDSDFLAELNYNEKCFNESSWLIKVDEISSGYTIFAGSGFETAEMFWNTYPGNEAFIPNNTYKGDGVVGVRSAKLTSVPCYQYNVKHGELNDDSDVIQDVIHLLNNESLEYGAACEPSPRDSNEPSLWQRIRIKTNDLILEGTLKTFEVILDYGLPIAEIGVGYPGSELDLTLRTPSGIVIDPSYASSDPNIDFTYNINSTDNWGNNYDEKYYTISNPETGIWTIEVTDVNVPPEGEEFSVGAMLKSDVTLLARTRDNIYSFASGEHVILEAFLWDGDFLNYPSTEVEAAIEKPDGTKEIIAFRDDGTNGDNIAGDGIFTHNYTDTMANGVYYANINANTYSFGRQTQLIFSINMLLDGVNLADFAIFALAWQTEDGQLGWDPSCNLYDSDSVIDLLDFKILAEHWMAGAQ